MLRELEIRDFAIIERLRWELEPGLNVLTGETGAGKSIIVDALSLLLGARADAGAVRQGAERAVVRGVLVPGAAAASVAGLLADYGVPEDPDLLISREVQAEGRSTARINGRAVPARALSDVGRLLVDTHGQGESASLLRESEHLEILDRYGGLQADRQALGDRVVRYREAREELRALCEDGAARARRAELLDYQATEIRRSRLEAGEEERLLSERTRLANAERLAVLADRAYGALRGEGENGSCAVDCLGQAVEALGALSRIDPDLAPELEGARTAAEALTQAASRLLAYRDSLEFEPTRLEEVEGRLALIGDLKRKYGPELSAVLAYADRAEAELQTLAGGDMRAADLRLVADDLLADIGRRAERLSRARIAAGAELSVKVMAELRELGMVGTSFSVAVTQRESADGAPVGDRRLAFDASGVDGVSFRVAANRGEPERPLVAVSSGGETARIMLALKTVLQAADPVPVLVFDEIDAGIGGRVGGVVGRRLWSLTARHQVLCVTHLPQVAAYGDVHWHVRKQVAGGRTVTLLTRLQPEDRVEEITQMLGTVSGPGHVTAAELLAESASWKAQQQRERPS